MHNLRNFVFAVALPVFAALPAHANLIITPTFDTTITSDTNAANIEATINTAIGFYEATFSDPINVGITFASNNTGLGQSNFGLFDVSYQDFYNALVADGTSPDDAAAIAQISSDGAVGGVPNAVNPVTGTNLVLIKSANAKALGFTGFTGSDGTITLNTTLTHPGSGAGTTGQYSLLAVTEHEIDEILGLGSTLGLTDSSGAPLTNTFNDPSPEDFFRFTGTGNRTRSFDATTTATSYFSIDGTTNLVQFNNTGNGDYGDWASGSGTVRVQDAVGTPGSNPVLIASSAEVRALDVIGYDLAAPEPSTWILMAGGLVIAGYFRKRLA